jgi:hypothetical protein
MWQATIWEPATRPAERASVATEQARLARLRRQVDERWRTLALASERAQTSADALERLYDAYMRAVDAYVAQQRALTRPRAEQRRAS